MAAAEITQEGKSTRIRYKDVDLLTQMSMTDARSFAKSLEDQVDQYGRGPELRRWLGGIAAVDPASRDALVDDPSAPPAPVNEKVKSAIEHTDPAWRHLGIDETAGDPDLREFEKTDAGFIRKDPNEKSPGVPADPEPYGATEPPDERELEEIMHRRGVPEPGDARTAMDPVPEIPDN